MLHSKTHWLSHLAAFTLFALIACLMTWPLLTEFSTRFLGHPFGDAYELARHNWWVTHALQTGQPVLPQPLLAYPNGLDGTLLWSYPLQTWPTSLFAFVMPLPAAYNLTALLRLAVDGWCAYWLARYLCNGRMAPALLAGALWMTFPALQGQLAAGHPGLLALWPLPLFIYGLLRLRETGLRRWGVFAAVCFAMSQWGSTQLIIFTLLPFLLVDSAVRIWRRDWRTLAQTLAVCALGGLLSLPFALPMLGVTLNNPPWLRPPGGIVTFSADGLAAVSPSLYHPLFEGVEWSRRVLGIDPFEGAGYLGIVAGVLALVGVFAVWRRARLWLAVGTLSWLFSLGVLLKLFYEPVLSRIDGYATFQPMPWTALFWLPLVNITRAPARFNLTVGLMLALLAALGLNALWPRLERLRAGRWLVAAALIGAVVFEYQWFWPYDTVPGVVPEPIAALRDRTDIRAVFDVPYTHLLAGKEAMWLQTGHQHPLITGHMTRQTPVNPSILSVLENTLDPALLDAAGVDIIILHRNWDDDAGELEANLRRHMGEPIYEDAEYMLFEPSLTDAIPAQITRLPERVEISTYTDLYVYVHQTGNYQFDATVSGDDLPMRAATLFLDFDPRAVWFVEGTQTTTTNFYLPAGYHTLTITANPPCPAGFDPTLTCRTVSLSNLSLTRIDE